VIASLPLGRLANRRLLAAAVALAAILVVVTAARAHAELVSSSPAANASLPASPSEVSLTFSEPVDAATAFIDLLDPAQRAIEGVGAVTVTADGLTATASLPELSSGIYTVSYQVVSAVDGHATTGIFAFLVDPDGTLAPPTTPPASSSPPVETATIVARWIGLAAALVAIGSLIMWWHAGSVLVERAPLARAGPPWPLIAVAGATAFAGLTLYLVLAARPIVEVAEGGFPLDPAAPFGWTPFALSMRVALAGALGATIVATVAAARQSSDRGLAWPVTGAVLLAIALAGMSMAGHAAANGGPLFAAFDWLHLVAVAAWLGGVPAAFVLARRARLAGVPSREIGGDLLRRHGRLALVAAPVVALTGIANSPIVVGSSRDLVASDYGNLIIAKALLLSGAVAIGAVNHYALRGRRRSVIAGLVVAELAIAAVAVGVAATMVTIQPASARQGVLVSPPVNPTHLFGSTDASDVHLSISPPTPGEQVWQVSIADRVSGAPPEDVQRVFAELAPPASSDLPPPDRVELEPGRTPGLYGATGAFTPIDGDWGVHLVIRRQGALDERLVFVVPIATPAPPEIAPPTDTGVGVPGSIAALWPLLPPGPLAWLVPVLAIAGIWLLGRARLPEPVRWAAAGVLIGIALVSGLAVGSRALVTAANAPGELAEVSPPMTAEEIARGEAIYLANCSSCHGRDADGNGPVRTLPPAGGLVDAVRHMSAAELGYRIANGVAGTPMPAFAGELTESERLAIVAYLRDRWADEDTAR
jgi:copper transport protein